MLVLFFNVTFSVERPQMALHMLSAMSANEYCAYDHHCLPSEQAHNFCASYFPWSMQNKVLPHYIMLIKQSDYYCMNHVIKILEFGWFHEINGRL